MLEIQPLVPKSDSSIQEGLSVFFTSLCIIDLFGVFPIVALPKAIISCGWFGFPLAFCILSLQVYTAVLLGRCWLMAEELDPTITLKSRYPYPALAEMTYGSRVSKLVTLLVDVTVFGSGIPNLLIAAENFQKMNSITSSGNDDLAFCYWLFVLGIVLCPLMWLGSPKDMKCLAVFSTLAVLASSVLTWWCLLNEPSRDRIEVPSPSWQSVAVAYGILSFQFDIHPVLLTVQVDMADKSQLGHAILAAFSVTCGLSAITCCICYMYHGDSVHYNLLEPLSPSAALYVDFLLVTLQIFLSSVVGGSALFLGIEDALGIQRKCSWQRCFLRTTLVMLMIAVAAAVPRFDLVMGLVGGSLTAPLMFVFPTMFYARLRAMQPQPVIISSVHQPLDDYMFVHEGLRQGLTTVLEIHSSVDRYVDQQINWEIMFSNGSEIDKGNDSYKMSSKKQKFYKELINDNLTYSDRSFCGAIKSVFRSLSDAFSLNSYPRLGPVTAWENTMVACIVICGVAATIISTYYNVRDTIHYATFIPPCLMKLIHNNRSG